MTPQNNIASNVVCEGKKVSADRFAAVSSQLFPIACRLFPWRRSERRVPCGVVYTALQGVSGWLLAVRLWNYFG